MSRISTKHTGKGTMCSKYHTVSRGKLSAPSHRKHVRGCRFCQWSLFCMPPGFFSNEKNVTNQFTVSQSRFTLQEPWPARMLVWTPASNLIRAAIPITRDHCQIGRPGRPWPIVERKPLNFTNDRISTAL